MERVIFAPRKTKHDTSYAIIPVIIKKLTESCKKFVFYKIRMMRNVILLSYVLKILNISGMPYFLSDECLHKQELHDIIDHTYIRLSFDGILLDEEKPSFSSYIREKVTLKNATCFFLLFSYSFLSFHTKIAFIFFF